MTLAYAIISMLFFFVLTVMLSSDHIVSRLLRAACLLMAIYGLLVTLNQAGFLVAAPEGMRWF